MLVRIPRDRYDVKISSGEKVLDIGGGQRPFKYANVVVDKYETDNTHRGENLKLFKKQRFIQSDALHLPFRDKEFDYINCCHVAEHIADPEELFTEISRVGKRGYLEVPSLTGEFLAPKATHLWVSLNVGGKLVMMKKSDVMIEKPQMDFGKLFLYHLGNHSVAFKILKRQYPDLFTVRQEWKDSIEYLINPDNEHIRDLFMRPWDNDVLNDRFHPKGKLHDTLDVWRISCGLFLNKITGKSSW